jgi:N-acetylglucosaminyldiphosphoundecaprenol N-acetyl-beta-D-mannosaminyltransferase
MMPPNVGRAGSPDHLFILGVRVDLVTFDQTLASIEHFIATGRPHQIVTVNPEFVMTAQTDPEFRRIINQAALALPDGVGVCWASRRLGRPLPERVPGVDLVERLAALSARKGYRIYFLGAQSGVAEQAAARLEARHMGMHVAGTYAGSPDTRDEADILARIRAGRPHILLVAYGATAQDHWIARNLAQLSVPVCMGVGGSFDYLAGVRPLAPRWLRRMVALPRFAWRVCRSSPYD